jgi:bifunctional non-homologous end joining protein LigD
VCVEFGGSEDKIRFNTETTETQRKRPRYDARMPAKKRSASRNPKAAASIPGAHKAPMPEFVSPQLATLQEQPPEGDHWFHELKFDGYRLLCHLNDGQVRFWTRNRKDWTPKFQRLAKAVKDLPVRRAILDGEVVAVDEHGRASFQRLQQALKAGDGGLIFHVFDLIYLDGYSFQRTPLIERKKVLAELFDSVSDKSPLRYSDHIEGNGLEFFKQACKHSIEGIVSKRADSVYESTRSRSWVKVKCIKRQEFVIAGYTISDKGFPGFGALVLAVYDKGKLVYCGRAGTGFTIKQRVDLQKKLDQIARSSSPIPVLPKDPGLKNVVWASPKLVGEVAFTEWTDDGVVRHPSFQGLREDKKAKDVVREEPQ